MTQQGALLVDRPQSALAAASLDPAEACRRGIRITLERLDRLRDRWLIALPGIRRDVASLGHQLRLFAAIEGEAQRLCGYSDHQVAVHTVAIHEIAARVDQHQRELLDAPVDFPFSSALEQLQRDLHSQVLEPQLHGLRTGLRPEDGRLLAYARCTAVVDAWLPPASDLAGRLVVIYDRDQNRRYAISEALLEGGCAEVLVFDNYADALRTVRSREPSAVISAWACSNFADLLLDAFQCRGIGTVLCVDHDLEAGVKGAAADLGVTRVLAMPARPSRIVSTVIGAIDGYCPLQTAELIGP